MASTNRQVGRVHSDIVRRQQVNVQNRLVARHKIASGTLFTVGAFGVQAKLKVRDLIRRDIVDHDRIQPRAKAELR